MSLLLILMSLASFSVPTSIALRCDSHSAHMCDTWLGWSPVPAVSSAMVMTRTCVICFMVVSVLALRAFCPSCPFPFGCVLLDRARCARSHHPGSHTARDLQ